MEACQRIPITMRSYTQLINKSCNANDKNSLNHLKSAIRDFTTMKRRLPCINHFSALLQYASVSNVVR